MGILIIRLGFRIAFFTAAVKSAIALFRLLQMPLLIIDVETVWRSPTEVLTGPYVAYYVLG